MNIKEEYRKGNILVLGFSDSKILKDLDNESNALFGVSFDSKAVQDAYNEGFYNVFDYNITNINKLFSDGLFDTIILDRALHKVFTLNQNQSAIKKPTNGAEKTILMMSQIWGLLRDDGIVIISDSMKPSSVFRYDTVSYNPPKEFSEYITDIGEIDKDIALSDDVSMLNLTDFLLFAKGYVEKTMDVEYMPFDPQELQYYLGLVGFEILKASSDVDKKLIEFARNIGFYNLGHENIFPNTEITLKLRKK